MRCLIVAVAIAVMAAACGGGPPSVEDVPTADVTASVLAGIDLESPALSRNGKMVFGFRPQFGGPPVDLCVVELDAGARETCYTDDSVESAAVRSSPRWSPDDQGVVWSGSFDILHFDVASGELTNLTDDGYVDQSSESLGLTDHDTNPAWLDNTTIVFMRRGAGELPTVVSVDLDGLIVGSAPGPTYTGDLAGETIVRSRWDLAAFASPLVTGSGILVSGDGVIYRIDPDSWEITEVGDYARQYDPYGDAYEEFGFRVRRPATLPPVGELGDGRLLLWDPSVLTVYNQGGWSGAPFGLFVFDPTSGAFEPLVAASGPQEGYVGPLSFAISPSATRLIVSWLDDSPDAQFEGIAKLSLIDLEAWQHPLDLRAVPELWAGGIFTQSPHATWAANDRIVVLGEVEDAVLQLDAP